MRDAARRPRLAAVAAGIVIAASVAVTSATCGHAAEPDPDDLAALPLVEVPADRGRVLAIFLTGDGGWAALDRSVSRALAKQGVAVVGLKSCDYLAQGRTPEELAGTIARVMDHYMRVWHRDRVALIGYSRGADLVPFAASRLSPEHRYQLALVAMLGLADAAGFECHWSDLVADVRRATDRAVVPELERLADVPLLCIYGTEEERSPCRTGAVPAMQRIARSGGHHFDRDYDAIAGDIAAHLARE